MLADRRLCLDRSLSRLVEESDQDAAFLLAATGQEIPRDAVLRLQLRVEDGRVVQGPAPEPVSPAPLADVVQPAGAMPEPPRRRSRKAPELPAGRDD